MSHIVHLLNPAERVKANLQDAASLFPKGEGHSEKKALEERWRLIWNISEPDRLIDAFINGDQCHCDVLTHQGECGDLACLAVGNGHDDGGLQRTYRDLEAVLAKSLRRRHTVEWLHLVQTQCKGYDLPCRAVPVNLSNCLGLLAMLHSFRKSCILIGSLIPLRSPYSLGSTRETSKGTLLTPTYGSLKRHLIERVHIPKGPPNPNSHRFGFRLSFRQSSRRTICGFGSRGKRS